jgi:hypothetical protein
MDVSPAFERSLERRSQDRIHSGLGDPKQGRDGRVFGIDKIETPRRSGEIVAGRDAGGRKGEG